ncbi:MAG TPA: HD domain-containing protein [Firmicutes bacterium]|nr:HD domain-containing protein [Bacillota bacterium]
MEKQFVAGLKVGDTVCSEFLVTEKSLAAFTQPNRAGEQFLRLQLADVSGSIKAVAWERGPELADKFAVGDVVLVRGEVSSFRGLQLVVTDLSVVDPQSVKKEYFLKTAPRPREEMLKELRSVLLAVTEPALQELLGAFFGDEAFFRAYTESPAARSVHHNYVGGLLEHSLEVAALCRHFVSLYRQLDLSLLLAGALLHDMGKIEEYEIKGLTIELTTRGKLLGHIMIGAEMLSQKVKTIAGFPEALYLELLHMVLAHHGHKEWGSPEVPRTFAAYALFHADLISARLNQFAQVAGKGAGDNGWTEWDRLLERDVFLGLAE